MALTEFQRGICRLIATNRIEQGESYVAGGVALNTLMHAPRVSRDIDLFHDTEEALQVTWDADRALLGDVGYSVEPVRERSSFIQAVVSKGANSTALQWVRDSAYRFFPLVEHEDFGLTLHPFDLATNKVLALVGRLEVRDWIDVIECSVKIQHLGYLAWAACGKDPGFNPRLILEEANRSSRYSAAEVAELAFAGPPPDATALAVAWRTMLGEAGELIEVLPVDEVGKCVLGQDGSLYCGTSEALQEALGVDRIRFHSGSVRGALPTLL
ncbi:hypothetical protein ACFL59_07220 [Planctomycetota bacterium]